LVDVFSAVVGAVLGAVLAVTVSYLVFFAKPRRRDGVRVVAREPTGRLTVASVSTAELDRSRREMRTMMVERDLLSSAMMKLYEAETEGRITRDEREAIAKRYGDQIKTIQNKLKDVELVVEVGELEKLREDLVNLFQDKIENIEARLNQAKERLGATAPELIAQSKGEVIVPARAERTADLEKVVEKRTRSDMSESERRAKQLREEVMDAVTQLEQMDIDRKPQESN